MKKRSSFTTSMGFVLAAAGSAVGLGNIWRFPYLAAKDGGGLFLVVYIVLALTFGFTLLTTEIAIGRKTKESPLTAYKKIQPKMGWLGIVACIIPMMILPYYSVIGGWVLKYFLAFLTGHGAEAAEDGYFGSFISGTWEPLILMLIFLLLSSVVVYRGVQKGIEKFSKILMPILVILVVVIAIFSLTLKSDSADTSRSGWDGFLIYVIPNLDGISFMDFLGVVVDAMGQLFYSLSVAMGIMIAYGSYVRDEDNLIQSINRIEIFDTLVAFFAGVMIIPAVYVFMGTEGMSSGPSLMFVSLPKVFMAMGPVLGSIVGCGFFAMVFFAALTSNISILEAVVSSFIDGRKISRKRAVVVETVLAGVIAVIVCLGYNLLYFEVELPNGSIGQILDILDYVSNNVLMPVVAIGTCILIGWVVKPQYVISEVEKTGDVMGRKNLYKVMVSFVAPVLLLVLLLKSLGLFAGV